MPHDLGAYVHPMSFRIDYTSWILIWPVYSLKPRNMYISGFFKRPDSGFYTHPEFGLTSSEGTFPVGAVMTFQGTKSVTEQLMMSQLHNG